MLPVSLCHHSGFLSLSRVLGCPLKPALLCTLQGSLWGGRSAACLGRSLGTSQPHNAGGVPVAPQCHQYSLSCPKAYHCAVGNSAIIVFATSRRVLSPLPLRSQFFCTVSTCTEHPTSPTCSWAKASTIPSSGHGNRCPFHLRFPRSRGKQHEFTSRSLSALLVNAGDKERVWVGEWAGWGEGVTYKYCRREGLGGRLHHPKCFM